MQSQRNMQYYFLLASTKGNESMKTLIGNPIPISKSIAKLFIARESSPSTVSEQHQQHQIKSFDFSCNNLSSNNLGLADGTNANNYNFSSSLDSNETVTENPVRVGSLMELLFNQQQPKCSTRNVNRKSTTKASTRKNPKYKNKTNKNNRKSVSGNENLLTLKSITNNNNYSSRSKETLEAFLPFKNSISKIAHFRPTRSGHRRCLEMGSKKAPDEESQVYRCNSKSQNDSIINQTDIAKADSESEDEDQGKNDNSNSNTEYEEDTDDSLTDSDSDEVSYGIYPKQSTCVSTVDTVLDLDFDLVSSESESEESDYNQNQQKEEHNDTFNNKENQDQDDDNYMSANESFCEETNNVIHGSNFGWGLDLDNRNCNETGNNVEQLDHFLDLNCKDYFKNIVTTTMKVIPVASSSCSRTSVNSRLSRTSANTSDCNKEIPMGSYFRNNLDSNSGYRSRRGYSRKSQSSASTAPSSSLSLSIASASASKQTFR